MKLEFSRHIFENSSDIKPHENPPSGSQLVPCGRTDGETEIVAFRSFARAPKLAKLGHNETLFHCTHYNCLCPTGSF